MGSPFIFSGIRVLDSLGFMSRSVKRREQVWENLHVSPWTAPFKGAKLCTCHHWFGRPSNLRFEPYYQLPMGISKLRALVQFRLGSHALPIEQGRFARPALARHLHRCTVCDTRAVGDELLCVFDCPHFSCSCRAGVTRPCSLKGVHIRCLAWLYNPWRPAAQTTASGT